jgi:hypothetical protein
MSVRRTGYTSVVIDLDTDEFSFPVLDLESPPATSANVRIDVAALSDKGRVRQRNEDHYFVARGGRHVTTRSSTSSCTSPTGS